MAFSIRYNPQFLSPTNNEIVFVVEPPTISELVRYSCRANITVGGEEIVDLSRQPNTDGFMIYDISYILDTTMDKLKNFDDKKTWYFNDVAFKSVDIDFFGEAEGLKDYNITNSSGKIQVSSLSPIGAVTNLIVGDEVIMLGSSVPTYNNKFKVFSITNDNTIVLDGAYVSNTSTGNGTIYKASATKWVLDSISATTFYCYNAGYNWDEFIDYDWNTLNPTSAANKDLLVSTLDKSSRLELDINSNLWASVYSDVSGGGIEVSKFRIITNRGTFQIQNPLDVTGKTYKYLLMKMGPKDITETTETVTTIGGGSVLPVFDANTTNYTIRLYYDSEGVTTDYNFKIVDYCSRFNKYNFLYFDDKGAMIPITFNLLSRKQHNVKRENIKTIKGGFDGTDWGYKTYDRGLKTVYVENDEIINVNSDWVDNYHSTLIQGLIRSTDVYVQDPTTGKYKGVVIMDTSYEDKNTINDKLIQYEITFKYANNNRPRIN